MMKWLKFSGMSVIVTMNPLHWRLSPWAQRDTNEWAGPREITMAFGWLAFTLRIWIDDGSW